MNTLIQKDFSAGWIPSDDKTRGRRNGLLRMDNLQLDEHGAITITNGAIKVNSSPFDSFVHSIYSRSIDGTRYRYVGLTSGKCLRDTSSAGTFATTIANNGAYNAALNTAFAASFNNVLICHGSEKIKDKGGSQVTLGVKKPTAAVTVAGVGGATLALNDSYALTAAEGTVVSSGAGYGVVDNDVDTFRFDGYRTYSSALNATVLSGSTPGTEEDAITLSLRLPDSNNFISFQLLFYFGTIDGTPDTSPDMTNYYAYQWNAGSNLILNEGDDKWTLLKALRSEFERVGEDNTKNWSNVAGVRIVMIYNAIAANAAISSITMTGGTTGGPLTGHYQYRQVNVENSGYIAKSGHGPDISFPLDLVNGVATVTPQDPAALEAKINEVWIYRRKTDSIGGDPLGRWLLVKVKTSALGTVFTDSLSDAQALALNDVLNEYLVSVQDMTSFDDVNVIITNYFERTLYMTPRDIFISDSLNPDAIDTRFTIKISADNAETNLWMIKSGPSTLLVGTSNDIYEISGELQLLPDGTLNISVRPLGIKQPPTTDAVTIYKNTLFYVGTDGLNSLTGSVNISFNGSLDNLWNTKDCHGQLSIFKAASDINLFSIAASKGKLFVSVTNRDTSHTCLVYDFRREYWYNYKLETGPLFTEEDDTLLAGFTNASNYYLRKIDFGTSTDAYALNGQPMLLRTPLFDDNTPFNRKDAYTLKLHLETGGFPVNIRIYTDNETNYIEVGTYAVHGMIEKEFSLINVIGGFGSSVPLAKAFMLEIQCDAINTFRLVEWGIEYDPRPKQTLALQIPPTNMGVAGRKRIQAISIMMDTVGGNVTFIPMIDGVDKFSSSMTAQTSGGVHIKWLYTHYFAEDVTGRMVGGRLLSQDAAYPFEFYEFIPPRTIEVLPDPTRFLILPPTNLGTQCRKRIVAIAFTIDTRGAATTFTPIIDNVASTPLFFSTNGKQTVIHYFTFNAEGTDISGRLECPTPFEYYDWDLKECITEKMPIPTKYLVIPQDNYGTSARKRFSSFKFRINTRGAVVTFLPRIDGLSLPVPVTTYQTTEPTTVEYFFNSDTYGIDIGGILSSTNPFEYYGSMRPEIVEKIPERVKFLALSESNFGIAAKKRVRTLPMVIDTRGNTVSFFPLVDGVVQTASQFNTTGKRTVLHYFETDSFGIDYGGFITGTSAFEFYEMLKPEDVQILPVGKKFDQLGPIEFHKLGKVLSARIRIVAGGTTMNWVVYADGALLISGFFSTTANEDKVYEVSFPKGVNATIFRMTLSADTAFHRYYARFKVNKSGAETESEWLMFGADPNAKPK